LPNNPAIIGPYRCGRGQPLLLIAGPCVIESKDLTLSIATRLKHAVEITPDKQHEFATVAQAEGVSLSVARRLLRVMTGPRPSRGVATLGRATRAAGQRAGPLLQVLDGAARLKVKQGTADEIFLDADPS
jgi:2-dehydro-3-deoxyphosphooctonate aldolase (KDO 8-P synthase)